MVPAAAQLLCRPQLLVKVMSLLLQVIGVTSTLTDDKRTHPPNDCAVVSLCVFSLLRQVTRVKIAPTDGKCTH